MITQNTYTPYWLKRLEKLLFKLGNMIKVIHELKFTLLFNTQYYYIINLLSVVLFLYPASLIIAFYYCNILGPIGPKAIYPLIKS